MPRRRILFALGVYLAAAFSSSARPAMAQFVQYTPPGALGTSQVSSQEDFEKAMKEARWQMGPLRLSPWYALRDFGYVDNVFGSSDNPKSDYTATVGAGLRGYLGSKATLAFHALPEYVWWADLENRRRLGGRYGAGLFGYFDRLSLETEATSSNLQEYISSEVEQPVGIERRRGAAAIELEFVTHLAVFASGALEEWRYDDTDVGGPQGARLLLLDRTENVYRGGLRYGLTKSFTLGAGVEYSDVLFARTEYDRSNKGVAPLVELNYTRTRFMVDFSAAYRSLEPTGDSIFLPFEGATGRFSFGWRPGSRLSFQVYGSRNLVYSLYLGSTYYLDDRLGVGVAVPLGWRILARAYYERGKNDYVMLESSDNQRLDDLSSYGGSAEIELGEKVRFYLGLSRQSYESNLDLGNRSIFRFQFGITFGEAQSLWF